MYKKLISVFAAIMILTAGMFGCTSGTNEATDNTDANSSFDARGTPQESGQKLKIASLYISSANPSNTDMVAAMKAKAESLGHDFSAYYYDNSVAKMIEIIENLISGGVDILILQPKGPEDGATELNEAIESGMKVLLFDMDMPGVNYDYWFCADNYELGVMIGQTAGTWAKENIVDEGGEVIVGMLVAPTAEAIILRGNGIEDGIKEIVPDAVFAMSAPAWEAVPGMEAGENFLQAYPNMNLVVGINDAAVLGAYEAFVAAGVDHPVGMFATDAMDEALKLIAADTMYRGTVDLDLNRIGEIMVDYALALTEGASKPEGDEKVVYFPMTSITIENISEYVS